MNRRLLCVVVLALTAAGCVRVAEHTGRSTATLEPGTPPAATQTFVPTPGTTPVASPSGTTSSPAATHGASPVPPATAAPTLSPAASSRSSTSSGSGTGQGGAVVCVGTGAAGPCVPAADAATVIAALKALDTRGALITTATVTLATCASSDGECPSGATGVAIVSLATVSGETAKVFVYRLPDGTLHGVVLS